MSKFKVTKAVIKTVEVGKQNAGNKYVLASLIEDDPYAVGEPHDRTLFVPQDNIPMWEDFIAKNSFPPYMADYKMEEGLPDYQVKRPDGTLLPTIHNRMRILSRVNAKGEFIEDTRTTALQIIDQYMVKCVVSTAPVTPVVAPVAPAAGGLQ